MIRLLYGSLVWCIQPPLRIVVCWHCNSIFVNLASTVCDFGLCAAAGVVKFLHQCVLCCCCHFVCVACPIGVLCVCQRYVVRDMRVFVQ